MNTRLVIELDIDSKERPSIREVASTIAQVFEDEGLKVFEEADVHVSGVHYRGSDSQ